MPQFVFAYHGGGAPGSPEEGEKIMAAWMAWFGGMGDKVVQPGNPVGQSMTVSGTGVAADGGANPLSGYSVVSADTIEAACDMAAGCPIIADGGSVEVAELLEM